MERLKIPVSENAKQLELAQVSDDSIKWSVLENGLASFYKVNIHLHLTQEFLSIFFWIPKYLPKGNENICPHKDLDTNVQMFILLLIIKKRKNQMVISKVDKKIMVNSRKGMLVGNKKEWTSDTWDSGNKLQKCQFEQEKSNTPVCILEDSNYVKYKKPENGCL